MKRAGNLFDIIAEPDNLRIAFWKASRGKSYKSDVISFQNNLECELKNMRELLNSGSLDVGNYHYFKIYDPKERLICAASFPERVLHHAIMNVCDPYFERFQIYDSYATRRDKGTHKALDRATILNKRNHYFLKLDINKFFNTIDHKILLNLLQSRFKDTRLLSMFEQIIYSYSTSKGRGLPIGNLTSQYFANFYLAFLDHYIKEELQVKGYVRYMDDMILWGKNRTEMKEYLLIIEKYLGEYLDLHLNKPVINKTGQGLSFLGYTLFKDHRKLNRRSKKRFIRKADIYRNNLINDIWTQEEYHEHIVPIIEFVRKADTTSLRKIVFNKDIDYGLEPC
ncbi:MAG: RNA-directed DNA polymerase [Candidatus Zophobacter franzmannii]|nr:RNA-directed DNA polymerase [Candidatus Zophobacter franzmannii]